MPDSAIRRPATAGDHLRSWRQRRRLSQLDLALDAGISQRHLSFLESGRSVPSREMLIRLTERLDVPLRERNAMLLAAGFAPLYAERSLDDPAMEAARRAIGRVLKGHEPYPALAIDRHWNLIAHNDAVLPLLGAVSDASLLQSPINVLRLSLHPDGLAGCIANLAEWREHLLERLRHQIAATNDVVLQTLYDELAAYPVEGKLTALHAAPPSEFGERAGVLVPLELITDAGLLSLISITSIFGTPRDVTLSELALEAFFPANAETAKILLAQAKQSD